MNLIQRIGFYLIGLALGSIVVYFIWSKKETSFCYLPNCRVLKDIRIKKREYAPNIHALIINKTLDTAAISDAYRNGSINFKKSKTKLKSCKQYYIDSDYNQKYYEFLVENCDSIAIIKNVIIK